MLAFVGLGFLTGVRWILHVALISIPMIANEVEHSGHVFTVQFAIASVCLPCPLANWIFCFLAVSFFELFIFFWILLLCWLNI